MTEKYINHSILIFQLKDDYIIIAIYKNCNNGKYEVDLHLKDLSSAITMFCIGDVISSSEDEIENKIAVIVSMMKKKKKFDHYIDLYCEIVNAACDEIERKEDCNL